jgi:hypothetical protein
VERPEPIFVREAYEEFIEWTEYLDEQAFRFNERKDNDAVRFLKAIVTWLERVCGMRI